MRNSVFLGSSVRSPTKLRLSMHNSHKQQSQATHLITPPATLCASVRAALHHNTTVAKVAEHGIHGQAMKPNASVKPVPTKGLLVTTAIT